MKIKYFIIVFLCLLSFYYTERIALYVKSKHPLVQEIESKKDELIDYLQKNSIIQVYGKRNTTTRAIAITKGVAVSHSPFWTRNWFYRLYHATHISALSKDGR